jgi:hypothetical protein
VKKEEQMIKNKKKHAIAKRRETGERASGRAGEKKKPVSSNPNVRAPSSFTLFSHKTNERTNESLACKRKAPLERESAAQNKQGQDGERLPLFFSSFRRRRRSLSPSSAQKQNAAMPPKDRGSAGGGAASDSEERDSKRPKPTAAAGAGAAATSPPGGNAASAAGEEAQATQQQQQQQKQQQQQQQRDLDWSSHMLFLVLENLRQAAREARAVCRRARPTARSTRPPPHSRSAGARTTTASRAPSREGGGYSAPALAATLLRPP